MKILIFGHGTIAKKKYLPFLLKAYFRENKLKEFQPLFIDIRKENCFEVENWENEPQIPVKEINKVIILSPPSAHLSNFKSIVRKFHSTELQFPDIYIEKQFILKAKKEIG